MAKGELRLEMSAFVRPGRRTMFVHHARATCVSVALARDVLAVYEKIELSVLESDAAAAVEARQMIGRSVGVREGCLAQIQHRLY